MSQVVYTTMTLAMTQNNYGTLHCRIAKRIKLGGVGRNTLNYFNIVRIGKNGDINGFVCGPNFEFRYQIKANSLSTHIAQRKNISQPIARAVVSKCIKQLSSQAASDLNKQKFSPTLTSGEFYIRRSTGKTLATKSGNQAVTDGKISKRFLSVACRWGFRIIKAS